MNFDSYNLDPSIYDEMFLPDGAPREHWRPIHETLTRLSTDDLGSIQERVTRSFSNEGISFTVYGDEEGEERIIPIDCVPRLLSGAEWRHLEAGLAQRVRALNLFLEDVYGPARIINDGVIPVGRGPRLPAVPPRDAGCLRPSRHVGRDLRDRPLSAPTTAFACWKTTCASPPASPT